MSLLAVKSLARYEAGLGLRFLIGNKGLHTICLAWPPGHQMR